MSDAVANRGLQLKDAFGSTMFYALRRGMIVGRYFLNLTYDPDYLYVKRFKDGATILDIGANGGQSALEFGRLLPKAKIISFEANPDNLRDLKLTKQILGERYTYNHVALSDHSADACLYVPVVGNTPVPGEASLEPQLFDEVEKRIGKISRLIEHPIALRTLDSFRLKPDFVKIDVQGHEQAVLRGMVETLRAHRPILMLEMCAGFDEVKDLLEKEGYTLCTFNQARGELEPLTNNNTVNFFAVPQ